MASGRTSLASPAPTKSPSSPTPAPLAVYVNPTMDHKRAKTLEALEKFIQSQKALLERTHADIERLKELRKDVQVNPPQSLDDVSIKLSDPAFKLSEQLDAMPPVPQDIDWSVFGAADPNAFRTMAATAREAYASRNVPPKAPLKPPSDLRQLVAKTRISVLDPVLNAFRLPEELALLSDDEPDPEEVRRAREREKIRELKKRRIEGDAEAPVCAGLGLRRPAATQGVFIRRDQEDESAEVDISMDDEGAVSQPSQPRVPEEARMDVDISANAPSLPPASPGVAAVERRSSRKVLAESKAAPARAKNSGKAKAQPKGKAASEDSPEPSAGPPRDKNGKVKSDTYKQAWSVSEQHLLERLLEEIPDGEKNRWSKISKAMNGRRTARQVASRVQKYYEKLKRFGVEVGGSKGAPAAGAS
ncbi:hypothetical protein BD413DRAFT_612239 [Trametes elegans]|nr:hypothetical protein BD413DRAFT_612239 [Trametes elegans]